MTDPRDHVAPFAELECVWVAPHIPARKERNARKAHRIPAEETVLVLYDDTAFGGGADGLLLTDRRVSSKPFLESPRSVDYGGVGDALRLGTEVHVGGLKFGFKPSWSVAHAERLERFLLAVARPSDQLRWRDEVLAAVRTSVGMVDAVYLAPSIPPAKERSVRQTHALPDHEEVLAIFDDTLFGSARDHWVFTPRRFAWKKFLESPDQLPWGELAAAQHVTTDDQLLLGPAIFPLGDGLHELGAVFDQLLPHAQLLEPRNQELEALIREDPDDDTNFHVLADWLSGQGHPRGQLAALQARGEDPAAWLAAHAAELGRVWEEVEVTWRLGFWERVHFYPDGTDSEQYHVPRLVLGHPSARFLREVRVGRRDTPLTEYALQRQIRRALERFDLPLLGDVRAHGFDLPR